jgi:hypothetical protein
MRDEHDDVPVTLTREQASLDDSAASTAQTVERMAQHITSSAGDPFVIEATRRAVSYCRVKGAHPEDRKSEQAKAIWFWIKANIHFEQDDARIRQLFREPDQLELLIEPRVLLRMRKPAGDCDDFTMLACAIMHELGIPNWIVTVRADRQDASRWSHVYCAAVIHGRPFVMDCSHGQRPGWEVPYFFGRQFWDSRTGAKVGGEDSRLPYWPVPIGTNNTHCSTQNLPSGMGLWR